MRGLWFLLGLCEELLSGPLHSSGALCAYTTDVTCTPKSCAVHSWHSWHSDEGCTLCWCIGNESGPGQSPRPLRVTFSPMKMKGRQDDGRRRTVYMVQRVTSLIVCHCEAHHLNSCISNHPIAYSSLDRTGPATGVPKGQK